MQIHTTVAAMQSAASALRAQGKTLGLVPTMGALHEGHLSLVRRARAENDLVAATIFVNPLQFAPTEDLARYPRTFDADRAALEHESVDLLFFPSVEEMYPSGATTRILVGPVAERLDGASRPGHFTGVATVVAKLFHIAQPTRAYFGQKDAAQLAVLRQMAHDLNFPLTLVACPIVRDPDGLALSSRNRYLSPGERAQALVLPQILFWMEEQIRSGRRDAAALVAEAAARLARQQPAIALDYLAAVEPDTLLPVDTILPGTLIAVAAKIGATRLIDNLLAP